MEKMAKYGDFHRFSSVKAQNIPDYNKSSPNQESDSDFGEQSNRATPDFGLILD